MATELMAEVAAAGWPGWDVLAVREVRLLKGITVEGAGVPLKVMALPRAGAGADPVAAGPTLDLTVSSGDAAGWSITRAVVELGRDPGSARDRRAAEVAGGAAALEGAGRMPMSVAEAYRSWLFHGPIFQGIVAIESIGPGGARAVLRRFLSPGLSGRRPGRRLAVRSGADGQRAPDAGPVGAAALGRDPAPLRGRGVPPVRPDRGRRVGSERGRSGTSCGSAPRARRR